jgi:hypothetical protein
MNYLEAAGYLDSVEADAKVALAYLLNHEFGKALMVGQSLFKELPKYREAISYFIEHDKAQPLARHYNKAYEITCKAVPLLQEAIDSCQQVGEAEAKGSIWGGQIKNLLETRVLPWLNDRHQEAIAAVSSPMGDKMEAPIEKGPQKGENKPQQGNEPSKGGRPTMKTIEDLFKVSEEIGQGVKSEIQGGREMTGTRTNRQGAANPLAIEYNKRSEAMNGLRRLNGILGNHDVQLTFVGRGKRAADKRLLHKLASESKEAEAIARAVCGYVIDHPDDSIVAGEAKRAYGHNDTLLNYQGNGKVGDEVVLGLGRLTYWEHLAFVDIELQEALSWIPATAAANSQVQAETTPQKGENKPQRGRRGRPKASIAWTNKDHNKQCQLLHKLADGKKGRSFALIIKAAVQLGWFVRPPFLAITSEFGDIGSESGYNKQMGLKNDEGVKPFMNLLEKESQI